MLRDVHPAVPHHRSDTHGACVCVCTPSACASHGPRPCTAPGWPGAGVRWKRKRGFTPPRPFIVPVWRRGRGHQPQGRALTPPPRGGGGGGGRRDVGRPPPPSLGGRRAGGGGGDLHCTGGAGPTPSGAVPGQPGQFLPPPLPNRLRPPPTALEPC